MVLKTSFRVKPRLRLSAAGLAVLLAFAGMAAAGMDAHTAAFVRAVRTDDTDGMRRAVEELGPGLATIKLAGAATPLHIAAALNHTNAVALLLDWGADREARTTRGFTPLHWAAGRDAADAADRLIRAGAAVEAATPHGVTPLHWAASNNATNTLRALLAAGAKAGTRTERGMTPLHWAVLRDAGVAAVALAFQTVSDQMDREPLSVESPDSESAGAPPDDPAQTGPPDAPPPPERPPPFGASLTVQLGFSEVLEFVWIAPLKLWAGKFEVTNGQFRRFRPHHSSLFHEGFSLNGNDQPVVYVSWNDAKAFCAWLNREHGRRIPVGCEFRLPWSAEWMALASCGVRRTYPWGNEMPPRFGNFSDLSARRAFLAWEGIRGYDDGHPVTCPVAASGANEWGLFGLAGNVWEWSEDWHESKQGFKVRHGGGWDFDGESGLRIETHGFDRPEARYDNIGFRLIVSRK